MAKKQKLNLIEELTTHKSDYKFWTSQPAQAITEFRAREAPAVHPPPPAVHIDPQSHAFYKETVHVPFDLYFKPKPIVGTDPRECFQTKKPPKLKFNRANCQRTMLLPPALPLDQVENEKDLNIILNYTYTRMHKVLMEEAALGTSARPKPPERVVSEGNDLRYKPELYPPLPPGWITAAKHWDCLQSRNLGDPFKTFWTRRGPEIQCSCCWHPLPSMLPKETREEIDKLITDDKLRLPYDVTKIGYKGYRPMVAKGVSLERK